MTKQTTIVVIGSFRVNGIIVYELVYVCLGIRSE